MKKTLVSLSVSLLLAPILGFPMAQWDNANRPEQMELKYERNFSKLPRAGKLKTLPWSDDYWATYKGGITYRWNQKISGTDETPRYSYKIINDIKNLSLPIETLSPAEKYDLYLGREEFPLTKYERARTNIMKTVPGSPEYDKNFKIPLWEGICHAWAPATMEFKNSEPVTVKGKKGHKITFGTSDLHALLSYHLHLNKTSKTGFMGSRCNLDFAELEKKLKNKEISKKQYDDQINNAECKDTNAGAFHVALVNQIALMDQGFVADVTRDLEVWNQPVYSFDVRILDVRNNATPGAAPGTVKEVTVFTRMGYVSEVPAHFNPITKPTYIKFEEYEYRIELNAAGNIIGGEWISFKRPDFIWKSAPVPFTGYFKELETIYKKSVQYLSPTRFTEEVKAKFKKAGRVSLIEREFIKDAKKEVALTKLREETHRIGINHMAVEGFNDAAKTAMEERVAGNIATLKKDIRTNFLASKFVEGAKEAARNAHIETAVKSANKKLGLKFLTTKFIKEVKGEVRDTHIENALESAKLDLRKDFMVKTFVKGMETEVNLKKAKEGATTLSKASIFINAVKKDANKTRKIKEEHKADAKAEVMETATLNFMRNKFIAEVSKDAKKSRATKEANKNHTIAAFNKFSNQKFYGAKFVKEVKSLAVETRKVKEAKKLAAQLKLNKELMTVVLVGDMAKFRELIKKGANPAYSDENGLTPLMIAAQKEHKTILVALLNLLDQKAINAVDKEGRNALIWAIVAPNQKPDRDTRAIVHLLLEKNIFVNQKDSRGMTALAYVTNGQFKSRRIGWSLQDRGARI